MTLPDAKVTGGGTKKCQHVNVMLLASKFTKKLTN